MDTYGEALAWLHSRLRFGIKPGLDRMFWLLEELGHPEKQLKAIHVGGTNGKGSTVTFLRSILQEAGYNVGTFTSPYIEQFNERISVNGIPATNEEITLLVNKIKPLVEKLENSELGPPTEFEVITIMAIYYFAAIRPVDVTLFEVGLGGRLDSTNVIEPFVTIITNIGKDHTNILGGTIKEITAEKAGIVKQGVPLFTAVKQKEALEVLSSAANTKETQLYRLGEDFFVKDIQSRKNSEAFSYVSSNKTIKNLETSLIGRHQTENAALAIAGLLYCRTHTKISVTEKHIRAGLASAYWPGRMEIINQTPMIILDGAHNPEGMTAFATAMAERFGNQKIKIIFAALKDKDLIDIFAILEGMNAEIHFTEFNDPRSASADMLYENSGIKNVHKESDWKKLLEKQVKSLEQEDVLAITGSLYFISQVKQFIENVLKSYR